MQKVLSCTCCSFNWVVAVGDVQREWKNTVDKWIPDNNRKIKSRTETTSKHTVSRRRIAAYQWIWNKNREITHLPLNVIQLQWSATTNGIFEWNKNLKKNKDFFFLKNEAILKFLKATNNFNQIMHIPRRPGSVSRISVYFSLFPLSQARIFYFQLIYVLHEHTVSVGRCRTQRIFAWRFTEQREDQRRGREAQNRCRQLIQTRFAQTVELSIRLTRYLATLTSYTRWRSCLRLWFTV